MAEWSVRLPLTMLSNRALNRGFLIALYGALGVGGSAFSIMVVSAAVFSTAKLIWRRYTDSVPPEIASIAIIAAAYYASGLIMICLNPDDAQNYWLAIERLIFLAFLPLFFQLRLSDSVQLRASLEAGAAIGAIGIGGWAIVEWLMNPQAIGGFRASGAPGNPGPYATTAAVLLAVCLIASAGPNQRFREFFLFASVCAAFGLLMSGMRTLYPALVLVPMIVGFGLPGLLDGWKRYSFWSLVRIAAIVSVVGIASYGMVWARLSDLVVMVLGTGMLPSADSSVGQRAALWQCSWEAFSTSPITGLGRAGAQAFMVECTEAMVGQPLTFSHFHGALATAAAFGGLIEIGATFALLLVPVYWCWHYRHDAKARHGVVLILCLLSIYGLNGLGNLMLGHDIHDAMFVHFLTIACVFMVGREGSPARF